MPKMDELKNSTFTSELFLTTCKCNKLYSTPDSECDHVECYMMLQHWMSFSEQVIKLSVPWHTNTGLTYLFIVWISFWSIHILNPNHKGLQLTFETAVGWILTMTETKEKASPHLQTCLIGWFGTRLKTLGTKPVRPCAHISLSVTFDEWYEWYSRDIKTRMGSHTCNLFNPTRQCSVCVQRFSSALTS